MSTKIWYDPKTKRELTVGENEVVRQRMLRDQGWLPKPEPKAAAEAKKTETKKADEAEKK